MEDKFKLKSKVYFNKGSIHFLEEIKGNRALIVSDSIMEQLGYQQQVVDCLNKAGISSVVFSEVRPDPDVNVIAQGIKCFEKSNADVIVAIGGGSAIDAAKGILYFSWKLKDSSGEKVEKPLFVAIPSTSGTGSEVTDFTVITCSNEKICIVDEFIAPDIAILDSTCIKHVPQRVVVDTGIDVLVHAIEAYVSNKATDFTDGLAEKAIKLIFNHIEKLYKDPTDSDARDRIQNASCMAGMAFTNASLGITHSLAHALGARFHISHGRSNALLLNLVMEYNADFANNTNDYAMEKYARLATELQLPSRTRREGAVSFIQAVGKLKKSLGIEDNIRLLGVDKDEFEKSLEDMAEAALIDRCTPTNPKQPSKEDLINIYKKCY